MLCERQSERWQDLKTEVVHKDLQAEAAASSSGPSPVPASRTEEAFGNESYAKSSESDAAPIEMSFYAGAKSALQAALVTWLTVPCLRLLCPRRAQAADATLPWRRGRLVLLGQGRAGKSSTVRSLVGKPFDGNQASTVGVETASCEIQRGDAVDWLMKGPTSETESLVKQLLSSEASEKGTGGSTAAQAAAGVPPDREEEPEAPQAQAEEGLLKQLPVDEVVQKLDQDMGKLRRAHAQVLEGVRITS